MQSWINDSNDNRLGLSNEIMQEEEKLRRILCGSQKLREDLEILPENREELDRRLEVEAAERSNFRSKIASLIAQLQGLDQQLQKMDQPFFQSNPGPPESELLVGATAIPRETVSANSQNEPEANGQ